MKISGNQFISSFLCSFSQIMLTKNAATGLFVVMSIGLSSPIMLLGASIGVMSALLFAQFFQFIQFQSEPIHNGLYGFNAALAGSAVFLFLPASAFTFILVIFVGVISTAIMHILLQKLPDFPTFTVPFLLSIWSLLLLIEIFGIETIAINTETIVFSESSTGYFYAVMCGIGQVTFQGYWISGVVCVAGLLLHSYKVAAWAIAGSAGGLIVAYTLNFPESLAHQGLYGFNACLTAIALSERFTKRQWLLFMGTSMGIRVVTLLTRFFELLAMPALTAPFILASWIVIFLARTRNRN